MLAADCPVPCHPVIQQEGEPTLARGVQEAGQVVRVLLIRPEVTVVTTPGVTSTRIVTSPETGH